MANHGSSRVKCEHELIVNTSGTVVVEYTYDAWGRLLTTTGSMASTLGEINPLRYRGYVYDTETGLYYLQSRYYNPAMGRFINADAFASTGQGFIGCNMFAYCGNNPVLHFDPDGNEYRIVGAGFQLEIDIGGAMCGVEVIIYWDNTVCQGGGPVIAVYCYDGISIDANDAVIASTVAIITDNADLLATGNTEYILLIAAMIGDGFSGSASAELITGNEDFDSTESYEKSFTSINGRVGGLCGGVAYSDSCRTYSVGKVFTVASLFPGWSVSKTYYEKVFEYQINPKESVSLACR